MATPVEVIASELLKSAIDAEKLFGKTKDQSYKDKAVRLRRIVVNLQDLTIGTSSVATLNDLTDVTISAVANGQILTYNSTTSQWENQNPAVVSTPTLAQVTTAGNTTTNAITVAKITTNGSITAASLLAQGVYFNNTLVAAANNDVLVGLDINPTFTNGAFTGVQNMSLRVNSQDNAVAARFVSTSGSLYIVPRLSSLYGTYIGTHNSTQTAQIPLSLSANKFIFDNGNVLIGTSTDAGYKLDVNGTTRFRGTTYYSAGSTIAAVESGTNIFNIVSNDTLSIVTTITNIESTTLRLKNSFIYGKLAGGGASSFNLIADVNSVGGTTNAISLSGAYVSQANGAIDIFAISPSVSIDNGGGDKTQRVFNVSPTYTNSVTFGTRSLTGFYYNPTISGAGTFTYHRAIETTSGDVLLATTSGTVVAGGNTVVNMNYGQVPKLYVSTGAFLDGIVQLPTSLRIMASGGGINFGQQSAPSANSLLWFGNDSSGVYYGNYGSLGLRFLVSNVAQMTIASSTGNVLINTTTDAGYKLDVNGTARFSGNTYLAGDILVSNGGGTRYIQSPNGTIGFLSSNSTGYNLFADNSKVGIKSELYITNDLNYNIGIRLRTSTTQTSPSGYGYELSFQPQVNHVPTNIAIRTLDSTYGGNTTVPSPIYIFGGQNTTSGTYAHVVLQSDFTGERGNVGVGTISPAYKFHISSAAAANIYGTVQSTNASGTAAWVAFNDQSDNVVYRVFGSGASGTQMGISLARTASLIANLGGAGSFLLGTYSATNFIMGTGNAEKMRIVDSTGNILIATTTDLGNKLEVNGNINSTGYKINNTAGYTGTLVIVTNPPGQQNIDIRGGIIVNVF